MRKNAHKDKCGVQVFIVFLDKGTVIVVGCTLELIVELDAGVSGSYEVWKGCQQCFKHGTSQADSGRKWRIRKA